jgi:hypothetical protein
MMKKLETEEKKDQRNPESKIQNNNEVLFSATAFTLLTLHAKSKPRFEFPHVKPGHPVAQPRAIFRPPA